MKIEWTMPEINNYRGHCIGLISSSRLGTSEKISLVKQLPKEISYDEYIGLHGIINSMRSPNQVQKMFNKLFHYSAFFDWIDDLIDFVDRILA